MTSLVPSFCMPFPRGGLSYEEYYSDDVCLERRNRCRLSLAAYTYEFKAVSIMSDADYDELSKKIRKNMCTGNELMDKFFREEFSTDTGQWIHDHPELDKVAAIYYCLENKEKKLFRKGATVYERR
jgi:hypothetical protein